MRVGGGDGWEVTTCPFPRGAPAGFARRLGVALAVALTLALIAPAGIGAVGASTAGAADFQALDGAQPPAGFSIANVLANLDQGPGGNPTAFAFAPDGRIFVARKTGVLDVYDHGVKHVYADLRTEVNTYQSRGFIGLALDPNFAVNDRVYLMFTQELNPGDPDSPAPAGGQLISLESKAGQPERVRSCEPRHARDRHRLDRDAALGRGAAVR